MHIATDPASLPLAPRALSRGCAVTIGNFDGVHLGHQKLILRVTEIARHAGLPAVAITFDPHPLRVMLGDSAPPALMSLRHRLECFAELGVDLAVVMPFTRELAARAPEDFVQDVLVRRLNTRHLVVGYDYAFGKGRRGDAALLSRLGQSLGYFLEQLEPVLEGGRIVSSTRIREALTEGDVEEAGRVLGRPHCVQGVVARGMNRGGRLLGFPTANLRLEDDLLLPKTGVYAVLAEINPRQAPLRGFYAAAGPTLLSGVANVGKNPTFGDEHLRVETHLLDFHADIYGAHFRVHFLHRLRDERKFDGVPALMEQIQADARRARVLLELSSPRPLGKKDGLPPGGASGPEPGLERDPEPGPTHGTASGPAARMASEQTRIDPAAELFPAGPSTGPAVGPARRKAPRAPRRAAVNPAVSDPAGRSPLSGKAGG